MATLFNFSGKNMLPQNFRRLSIIDTAGNSLKTKGYRHVLFITEDEAGAYSIFVYDADKQSIIEWPLKNFTEYKAVGGNYFGGDRIRQFSILNSDYENQLVTIRYGNGKYSLTTNPFDPEPDRRNRNEIEEVTMGKMGAYAVAEPPPPSPTERRESQVKNVFEAYYQKKNDTLFFVAGEKDLLKIDTTQVQFIYQNPGKYFSQKKIIYKSGSKFGFHLNNKALPAEYDSLIYLGNSFLAGKIINGKMKFGIINNKDSLHIPIEYDSISGNIPFMRSAGFTKENEKGYVIQEKENDYSYGNPKPNAYSKQLSYPVVVWKNGKAGVINAYGKFLLAVEYDGIWKNGFNFMYPRKSEYYIIKRDGLYGAAALRYEKVDDNYVDSFEILLPPTQQSLPLYYYNDYFNNQGLRLFGLYDEQIKLAGFATGSGKTLLPKP